MFLKKINSCNWQVVLLTLIEVKNYSLGKTLVNKTFCFIDLISDSYFQLCFYCTCKFGIISIKYVIIYNILLGYNICMYSIVLFFKCRLLSPFYGICRRWWRETRSKAQTGMDVSFCTVTLRYFVSFCYILDHQQVLLSHPKFMCIVCN